MNSLLAATSRRTALAAFRGAPAVPGSAGPTSALSSRVVSGGGVATAAVTRSMSSKPVNPLLQNAYKYIYKHNTVYFVYIVLGAITCEMLFGATTDAIFDRINRGKLYKDIDWSKFKDEDEDEEEEEEEEEEDE